MKIKKCKKGFRPFKITIESQEELAHIVAALEAQDEEQFEEAKRRSEFPKAYGEYNKELDWKLFGILEGILNKCK